MLDDAGARDLAGDEVPGLGEHLVETIAVDEHEGGNLNRRKYGADVRVQVARELGRQPAGRDRAPSVAGEPLALRPGGGVPPVRSAPGVAHGLDLLLPARPRRHPGRLLGREVGDLRVDEDE